MALQPEDDGVFVWPPPHWQALTEYGSTAPLGPIGPTPAPPPPPPPPPPQRLGPDEQIEETAPPLQAAPPPDVQVPPPVAADAVSGAGEIVPQMPEVDAVSGVDAGAPPPIPVEEQAAPVVEGEQPESPYFDALAPSSWAKPVSSADLYTMAKRDPVAYAQHIQAMDQTAADEMKRREALVSTQNASKEEQDHRDLMDSMQKANEMRDQLLATRIDANRWRKSRTVPQSIAAFLSVVIGGLYQSRKGGPNIGMEIIDKAIDRDIAEQEANMLNQRNAISDLRAQGLSDFQAKQAYRIGWYQRAKDDVLRSMQDYDPAGTTARQMAQQALEIEAKIGAASEAGRRAKLSEELQRRKDERETLETLAKLRKSDAETAKLLARGTGGGMKAEDVPQPVEYFKAMYPKSPVPPRPMSEKEYNAWLRTTETGAKATQAIGAESPEEARRRELGIGDPSGAPLVNKDGQPFIARDKTVAEKLTKQTIAASEIADIIDEVIAIRERSGGESKLFNSDDRQRLDALQNQLIVLQKSGTEGMSSDEDMKKLADAIGASDVASFRSRSAGLEKGRERTVGFLNQTLRFNQYKGDPIKIPNRFNLPKAKATPTEEIAARALKTEYMGAPDPGSAVDVASSKLPAQVEANRAFETDLSTLAAFANTGSESEKQQAKAAIEGLAKNHPTAAGKARAAEVLAKLPGAQPVRER